MANHERPNLKQIRIKQSVCARLDERKGEDDSYTDVIKALLDENERLKARCQELENDKQLISHLAKGYKHKLDNLETVELDDGDIVLKPVEFDS